MVDLTGQIGLVYGPKRWSQRAVAWATDSPVYHTVIHLRDDLCVGAEQPHPIVRNVSHFPNVVWSNFDLSESQKDGIVHWLGEHLEATYNITDDIAIGLERILDERTPKPILRRLSSSQHTQCAQLADAAYTYGAGMQLFRDHRYFGAVAPADFVPLWQDAGWWPDTVPTTYRRHLTNLGRRALTH